MSEEDKMYQAEQKLRNKITLLTFICSLLVIWIHTYNLEMYGITADSQGIAKIAYLTENYWKRLTDIAVPLFFFVSGFLFFRTYELKDTWNKYRSRFKSILIPYVCWCTIYYLYFVLITNVPVIKSLMNRTEATPLSFLTWLRWIGPDEYYTLWFLQNLIVYILLCPVFYILLKDRKKVPVGAIVLIAGILNVYFKWIPLPGGIIEYAAGAWIAINHKEAALYRNKYLSVAGWIYTVYLLVTGFRWYGLVSELLLFVTLWFAFDVFSLQKEFPWWMKITFFTYVAHDILLEAIEKVFFILGGNKPVLALASYILIPVLVFGLLVGIAKFLKHFLPHTWSILTGAR